MRGAIGAIENEVFEFKKVAKSPELATFCPLKPRIPHNGVRSVTLILNWRPPAQQLQVVVRTPRECW